MFWLFLFLPLYQSFSQECRSPSDAITWIVKASDLDLHNHPHWLNLLHFHRTWTGVVKSDIDSPEFFLSTRGNRDARSELESTLRAFCNPADTLESDSLMPPRCRFPARYRFLKQYLGFEDGVNTAGTCPRLETWLERLNPESFSIVYASSYLNNPASMFGHTLIKIKSKGLEGSRDMLNYGVTYGANVPPDQGLAFIFKGLMGGYAGYYGIKPFFVSIQKYSNMENRELWEYNLNLSQTQKQYLIEHLWELGPVWMRYYFLDENCSYNLLTAIDAADPLFNFSKGYHISVIPGETVKSLLSSHNLLSKGSWRPSLLSRFYMGRTQLNTEEKTLSDLIIKGVGDSIQSQSSALSMSDVEIARAADVAMDFIQFKKRKSSKDDEYWSKLQHKVLLQRSRLPILPDTQRISYKPSLSRSRPESGHPPKRLGAFTGNANGSTFAGIEFRYAYHDYNADESGYLKGSQIELFKPRLRLILPESKSGNISIQLQGIGLLNVQSITPVDAYLNPWSFRLNSELIKSRSRDCAYCQDFILEAESGKSKELLDIITAYGLIGLKLRAGPGYNYNSSLGAALHPGMKLDISSAASIHVFSNYFLPFLGDYSQDWQIAAEGRWSIFKNTEIRSTFSYHRFFSEYFITLNQYF